MLPASGLNGNSRAPTLRAPADWKSAIQQTGGLRYSTRTGWFMVPMSVKKTSRLSTNVPEVSLRSISGYGL